MMVERRTEAVQEGYAPEPRAGGFGCVGVSCDACRSAQQPIDLIKKDIRHVMQTARANPKQRSPHSR